MTDYTPATRAVRSAYIHDVRNEFITSTFEAGPEFDRWLANLKAEVWDEGHDTGRVLERTENPAYANPYRNAKKEK